MKIFKCSSSIFRITSDKYCDYFAEFVGITYIFIDFHELQIGTQLHILGTVYIPSVCTVMNTLIKFCLRSWMHIT